MSKLSFDWTNLGKLKYKRYRNTIRWFSTILKEVQENEVVISLLESPHHHNQTHSAQKSDR
jgi:hypothetical protein